MLPGKGCQLGGQAAVLAPHIDEKVRAPFPEALHGLFERRGYRADPARPGGGRLFARGHVPLVILHGVVSAARRQALVLVVAAEHERRDPAEIDQVGVSWHAGRLRGGPCKDSGGCPALVSADAGCRRQHTISGLPALLLVLPRSTLHAPRTVCSAEPVTCGRRYSGRRRPDSQGLAGSCTRSSRSCIRRALALRRPTSAVSAFGQPCRRISARGEPSGPVERLSCPAYGSVALTRFTV